MDYLVEGRKRGFSDEVLKDDLLDNGFRESAIDDAFHQLNYQMRIQRQMARGQMPSSQPKQDQHVQSQKSSPQSPDNDLGDLPSKESMEKGSNKDPKKESGYEDGSIQGIKHRGWGLVLILIFVTFGIYGIVWMVKTAKELGKNTDSAPSPAWLWFLPGTVIGRFLTAGGLVLGLLGMSAGGVVTIVGYALLGISLLALLYFEIFYALAINELSGFSKVGIIVLWILLPMVAIPVSQTQLNKFANKD